MHDDIPGEYGSTGVPGTLYQVTTGTDSYIILLCQRTERWAFLSSFGDHDHGGGSANGGSELDRVTKVRQKDL